MTFTPHLGLRQRKPRVALLINRDSSGTVFPVSFSHIINNILFLTNYFFFFLATIAIITTAATATAAILHTIIGKRSVFCSGVSTVTFVGVEAAASVFSAVEEVGHYVHKSIAPPTETTGPEATPDRFGETVQP